MNRKTSLAVIRKKRKEQSGKLPLLTSQPLAVIRKKRKEQSGKLPLLTSQPLAVIRKKRKEQSGKLPLLTSQQTTHSLKINRMQVTLSHNRLSRQKITTFFRRKNPLQRPSEEIHTRRLKGMHLITRLESIFNILMRVSKNLETSC